MTTLLLFLWPALAAAAALGLCFAVAFGSGRGLPSARPDVRIGAGLLLLAGIAAMALELVPGRPGLWVDIGTLCALAYAAGAVLGTVGRRLIASRRRTAAP